MSNRAEMEVLLAQWRRDELAPKRVPAIAEQALDRGCRSDAVAVLAGASGESRRSIDDLLAPVLREAGLEMPSEDEALKIIIDDVASKILANDVEPIDGARRIWAIASERGFEEPVWSQVRPFVGLASEWEDHSEDRLHYESEIADEAKAMIDRGGLRLDPE